jgi:hypothetical protein
LAGSLRPRSVNALACARARERKRQKETERDRESPCACAHLPPRERAGPCPQSGQAGVGSGGRRFTPAGAFELYRHLDSLLRRAPAYPAFTAGCGAVTPGLAGRVCGAAGLTPDRLYTVTYHYTPLYTFIEHYTPLYTILLHYASLYTIIHLYTSSYTVMLLEDQLSHSMIRGLGEL